MSSDFGLKIGIEGERAFKDALRDINQSFKVLGSEMSLVASEFDKNDKSIQAITARNEVLNKQIETQSDKVETLRQALQNATESFGESDRRTQNWQIQLNRAQAELNNLERELSDNNKALESVNSAENEAISSTDKLGNELQETSRIADDSSNKFEALGSVLKGIGVALGTAFVAVGTASVTAAKSLADMTKSAATYADDMLTLSAVTGVSTDSLQAYSYASELVDVSLETMTGSMAKNVKSMSSAVSGSTAFANAYSRLGVEVANADGSLRNSEEVYWDTIDALSGISNETERDALAMQIFGKSAQELNPLIAQGSAGISALTVEAKEMGAVMSGENLNALGAFDDSLQRLSSRLESAKNALGLVLLPQLQVLSDEGGALLGNFTKAMSDANGDWSLISLAVGEAVSDVVDVIQVIVLFLRFLRPFQFHLL